MEFTYAVYPKTAIVSMPNKFFESIITETPIIADVNTEFGKIVEDKKFGFVINSNQEVSTQLKDILRKIINDKNILNVIKSNMSKEKNKYCWENNIETLVSVYEK
jgi:glycosyltransferase involved in cell wall biosynthesis